ncbi:MAG TPA: VTT domain-containing protein [Tepidisphaeraceae bacterium]|nr:VTT domain-containing protein [Tepidisphaeraceae bacterium]
MPLIHQVLDLFLHLDKHLNGFATAHQIGVYVLLAIIIFCETGLVVWPFLPGDSLLFAVGALAAAPGSPISLPWMIVLLCLAANCGDLVNYTVGWRIGPRIFSGESSWLLNKRHLAEAHRFYERHGRKTIILARFLPIIRTFAPFVAGIGQMPFARFIGFSVSGGILWVVTVSLAGFYFNQIEFVRTHFQLVVLAIIVISVIPAVVHALQPRRRASETQIPV